MLPDALGPECLVAFIEFDVFAVETVLVRRVRTAALTGAATGGYAKPGQATLVPASVVQPE